MKKLSRKAMLIIIIILLIIEVILCYFYFRNNSLRTNSFNNFSIDNFDVSNTNDVNTTILNTSSEITSAITENIELHTTYYLEESYVEEGEVVVAGANLVKYSNGEYLTAPYSCIINSINVPESGEECNNNYIEISSTSLLAVNLSVDESVVNNLTLGKEAKITISAYDDKEITGYITSISNTANNGNFTVIVEFENDGDIKLGMTAEVTI